MELKNNLARIAVAAPLLLVTGLAFTQGRETSVTQNVAGVAWVNVSIIMQQTPGYVEAESTFTVEMQGYQRRIQLLQSELDSAIADFDRSSVVLSPSVRQQREEQLRQLQQSNGTRAQQLQVEASRRERELVGPIEERVSSVIEGLRAERNLAMIWDVSAQGSGVVAADRSLDLTGTVVQRLQAQQ